MCVWGGHLARISAVGRSLALGALQERRRQRLAARGVAALEGHGAPEPSSLAVSALLLFVQEEAQFVRVQVFFIFYFQSI
jgi:hypothetical protein